MRSKARSIAEAIERPRVRLELADGEELEDAVLDLVDVVVVVVELLARVLQVEVVLGRLRPRQRGDPLEVAADHAVLGGLRRQPLEAGQLALRDRPDVLGELRLLELPAELLRLGLLLVDLAELLLDRAELLAEEVLALAALHLGVDLVLDPAAELDQLELAREDLGQPPKPLRHVALLEQLLLLLGFDAERPGDQVSQLAGVVEVRDRELQLLGQVGELLDDAGEGGLHVAAQALELGRLDELVRRLRDPRHQVGRGGDEVAELHTLPALHEDADGAVRHLHHPRDDSDHAHAIDVVGSGLLRTRFSRGDHHHHPVAGEDVVDELDRPLLAHGERQDRVGERDAVAQRQHRQRLREPRVARGLGGLAVHGWDVDRHGSEIGTRRTACSGSASGISTWSTPSTYEAPARSATTSAPSSTMRRNGPCSISICW
jgi:hypothetical protein